jgi:site-specific DNA-methyltransferase (adenine-specific)
MKKSKITRIGWDQIDTFLFASEIAWRRVSELYADASLDDIFCDPRLASKFDEIAAAYSPGFTSLEYRWAALKLRKEGRNARRRADASSPKKLGIQKFRKLGASPLDGFDFDSISNDPGVYALRTQDLNYVYAGETNQLSRRLKAQFGDATRQGWPELASTLGELELVVLPLSSIMDARFARQSQLLSWYKPSWNHNAKLAA